MGMYNPIFPGGGHPPPPQHAQFTARVGDVFILMALEAVRPSVILAFLS